MIYDVQKLQDSLINAGKTSYHYIFKNITSLKKKLKTNYLSEHLLCCLLNKDSTCDFNFVSCKFINAFDFL